MTVVPKRFHTHPVEDHWKFQGGERLQKPKCLKESMTQNWYFQMGGRGKNPEKYSQAGSVERGEGGEGGRGEGIVWQT